MDWTQVLTVFAVIATNLGTIISLYINLDKKLDEQRKETNEILRAIQAEMKDFHGKLERQDADFKGKIALQDADFKSHLLHLHGVGSVK